MRYRLVKVIDKIIISFGTVTYLCLLFQYMYYYS